MNKGQTKAWPVISPSDRRLYVDQTELAAAFKVQISSFFADLRSAPDPASGLDAQLLFGETANVLAQENGWSKIVAAQGGYIGWVETTGVSTNVRQPSHMVIAPRTFLYPQPDMKLPRIGYRSMGSLITVVGTAETRGTRYAILADGEAIVARHVAAIENPETDYVAVAERLIHTPYLWGGNTGFGIDCSGLVFLANRVCGKPVLRDTDMLAATIGKPVDLEGDWQNLQRGDLVFWPGHVAIAQGSIKGEAHLIHANGYTMDVASEPAMQAIERIAHLYELPIGVRRP